MEGEVQEGPDLLTDCAVVDVSGVVVEVEHPEKVLIQFE